MQFLRKIFGPKSGSMAVERPQDRTYDSPPVKTGEWSIIVDKNGDEVIDRPPGNNDFLMRPSVEYDFRGTIPKFDPTQYATEQERFGAATEHAMRAHKNEALLKKAMFLLSNTADGRRLLKIANEKGFHFVFNEDAMKEEGAAGMCDYANKQIPLAEGRTAEQVMSTLKHELQHMEDISKGVGNNSTHTLISSIMGDRALEANARASEAINAAETLFGDPNGPERQFRTNKVFAYFHHKNTPVATAALAALNEAKAGNWAAYAFATFKGYYDQHATLDYYDKRQVDMYAKAIEENPDEFFDPDTGHKLKPSNYRSREEMIETGKRKLNSLATNNHWPQNQEDLKRKITVKGKPSYLVGTDDLDLTDDKHLGFGIQARAEMNKFVHKAKIFIPNTIEQLQTALEAPKRTATEPPKTTPPGLEIYAQNDNFKMVRFPNREGGRHSNTTEYTDINASFNQEYERANFEPLELHRLYLTAEAMLHRSHMSMRGIMHRLIDSGYRAPVAAMPQEYIMHLCNCAKYAAETGDPNQFDEQDFIIMKHWEEMSERGLDPIYGSPDRKNEGLFFNDNAIPYINSYLKPFFDTLEAKLNTRIEMEQQLTAAPA